MIRSKKGMELAMSTIVVSALAVLVLVIMILMFTGKIKIFQEGSGKCFGECVDEKDCDILSSSKFGCGTGEVCCMNNCEKNGGKCQSLGCTETQRKNIFYKCPTESDSCCFER